MSTETIETNAAAGRPDDVEAILPAPAFPEVLVLEHGLPFDEVERRLGLATTTPGGRIALPQRDRVAVT